MGGRGHTRSVSLLAAVVVALVVVFALPSMPVAGESSIVFPGASWATKNPSEVGLDDSKLTQFVQNVGGDGVIIKNGYLIKSWGTPSARFDWASAAKPVTSTMLFFAIYEGKLPGVDARIDDLGWSLSQKDRPKTFFHLANMISGYSLSEAPGQAYAYNDYSFDLYSKSLFDRVYQTSPDVATRHASRLGALQFEDGSLYSSRGGHGLYTSPRDFARIGWFWLNKGNWNGQQLLPRTYFDTYAKPHVPSSLPRAATVTADDYLNVGTFGGGNNQKPYGQGIYGFNWWFNAPVQSKNNALTWPDAPADTFQANGHWGKEVLTVIPSLDLVVAARGSWGTFDPGNPSASMNLNLRLLKEAAVAATPTATPQPTNTPSLSPSATPQPTVTPQATDDNAAFDDSSTSGPQVGQVVVDPENPRWLKYQGGGPFFMCGPGDPEGFLYRGTRLSDGTRNGDQLALIQKLTGTGANAIYLMAVRSHGGDGDATHNPFVGNDPRQGLNTKVLDQWEAWFAAMDRAGIVIYFFFYDDSARIWDTGDVVGAAERDFIRGLVGRFKHHKHLVWVVAEEYGERYTPRRISNIAAEIRAADDRRHPIAVHKNNGLSFSEFAADPNIDQFAIQYNVDTAGSLHSGVVKAWEAAAGRYNLNLAEAAKHGTGALARKKNWAIAMGGGYVMVYQMDIAGTSIGDLEDCGRLVQFMEATDFHRMSPRDDLRFGGTEYVLANPGSSYIAYASALTGSIGLRGMTAGTYDFAWFDAVSGAAVTQKQVRVSAGDQSWPKPSTIGKELAVYLQLSTGTSTSPTATATPQAITPGPEPTATATATVDGPMVTGFGGVQDGQVLQGTVALEALIAGTNISRVDFALSGPKRASWRERVGPYYFMGDDSGTPKGWDTLGYPDGSYTLTATATDTAGRSRMRSIRFSVDN